MIDLNKIPNHPTYYQSQLSNLLDKCLSDLKYIIQNKFDGHYKYKNGEELIKIRSILGSPCIQELVIVDDEIKCSYLFWNGKEFKYDDSPTKYDIPQNETFNIYNTLYNISINQHQTDSSK